VSACVVICNIEHPLLTENTMIQVCLSTAKHNPRPCQIHLPISYPAARLRRKSIEHRPDFLAHPSPEAPRADANKGTTVS
jgi:hypothetical protein